jgi:hypothetical protein
MAATDECAQRACLRIAEVTVMHSVTTNATGLTATVMGRGSRLAGAFSWRVAASTSICSLDIAAICRARLYSAIKAMRARRVRRCDGGDIATCPVE